MPNIFQIIKNFFSATATVNTENVKNDVVELVSTPIGSNSKKQSISDDELQFPSLTMPLEPHFGVEWLPVLRNYAIFNADVSLAVDNICNLSNTAFEVSFSKKSKKETEKLNTIIAELSKKLRIKSVVNALLRQLAVNGCLSAEIVPNNRLTEVEQVALVNPFAVRFFSKNGKRIPHQKNNRATNGYQILADTTYSYIPLTSDNDSPYGLPPFLAALESLGVEKNLRKNFQKIAEKFGLFGFLEVLMNRPPQKPGEKDEAYWARCETYIARAKPEAEKSIGSGFVIGFKDSHEFRLTGGNTDAKNAQDMMMLNDLTKMSGLKQDPNLLGRQQSRAETFGRVLLSIFSAKVTSYQEIVADFLEKLFALHLRLQGVDTSVDVSFKTPTLIDQKLENEAEGIRIDNLIKLLEKGAITEEEFKDQKNKI